MKYVMVILQNTRFGKSRKSFTWHHVELFIFTSVNQVLKFIPTFIDGHLPL